MQFLIFQY